MEWKFWNITVQRCWYILFWHFWSTQNISAFTILKCFVSLYWNVPKCFVLSHFNIEFAFPYGALWELWSQPPFFSVGQAPWSNYISHHAPFSSTRKKSVCCLIGDIVLLGVWPTGENVGWNYNSHRELQLNILWNWFKEDMSGQFKNEICWLGSNWPDMKYFILIFLKENHIFLAKSKFSHGKGQFSGNCIFLWNIILMENSWPHLMASFLTLP